MQKLDRLMSSRYIPTDNGRRNIPTDIYPSEFTDKLISVGIYRRTWFVGIFRRPMSVGKFRRPKFVGINRGTTFVGIKGMSMSIFMNTSVCSVSLIEPLTFLWVFMNLLHHPRFPSWDRFENLSTFPPKNIDANRF
ncbi:hypothetical protein YC2023_086689 [Brassica napus]